MDFFLKIWLHIWSPDYTLRIYVLMESQTMNYSITGYFPLHQISFTIHSTNMFCKISQFLENFDTTLQKGT